MEPDKEETPTDVERQRTMAASELTLGQSSSGSMSIFVDNPFDAR